MQPEGSSAAPAPRPPDAYASDPSPEVALVASTQPLLTLRRDARATARGREDALAVKVSTPDFDTVYREERGRVLAAVRTIIGGSNETEDVVQLAFIEIHRCLHKFEGRSRLSTWVYRIATNVALQHLRKKKRKRWLVLGATGEETQRQAAPIHAGARLEGRQLLERVYEAADTLSEKKRSVWVLHELQGQDPQEISEILEIPMNTVRSRLLAARREIQAELRRRGVLGARGGDQ